MTERRWLILTSDGRHAWLGRNSSDPTPEEVTRAAASLDSIGLGAWLATAYYGPGGMFLTEVRRVTARGAEWSAAVAAFHEARRRAA